MQNADVVNSISTTISLVKLYKILLLLIIGQRGYWKNDVSEHELVKKIHPILLKLINLESRVVTDTNCRSNSMYDLKK